MCSAVAVPGGELPARASAVPVPSAMLEHLQPEGVLKTMRLYAQPQVSHCRFYLCLCLTKERRDEVRAVGFRLLHPQHCVSGFVLALG